MRVPGLARKREEMRQKAIDQIGDGFTVGIWSERFRGAIVIGVAREGVGSFSLALPPDQFDHRAFLAWIERSGDVEHCRLHG